MKDAYVALDFEAEMQKAQTDASMEAFYTLPDGQIVTFADQVCFISFFIFISFEWMFFVFLKNKKGFSLRWTIV